MKLIPCSKTEVVVEGDFINYKIQRKRIMNVQLNINELSHTNTGQKTSYARELTFRINY